MYKYVKSYLKPRVFDESYESIYPFVTEGYHTMKSGQPTWRVEWKKQLSSTTFLNALGCCSTSFNIFRRQSSTVITDDPVASAVYFDPIIERNTD